MIKISDIKLPVEHSEEALKKEIRKALKLPYETNIVYRILKQSIDARKEIRLIYSVAVESNMALAKEEQFISQLRNPKILLYQEKAYSFPANGGDQLKERPVIVGSGPAGLFCAYMLAKAGFQPIVLERGAKVNQRVEIVDRFWKTGELMESTNVQFGEGGAGTFSDGKLNTLVKDTSGRNKAVLELLTRYGAPSELLYVNKPHIGTDRLREVVQNIRQEIISMGGCFRFLTQMTDICVENNRVTGVITQTGEQIPCSVLVTAIGHSARDTFAMLHKRNLQMVPKAFAIGLRIEHRQELISRNQYGNKWDKMGAADYKLTHQCSNGRGVYSFCMCPGGFVVNSSSQSGCTVVNGMSNYSRNEKNANSALIVTVTPEDFLEKSPLAGVAFQQIWEQNAFQLGKGHIPIQLFGDFARNRESNGFGSILPVQKGAHEFANLRRCLPEYICESLLEGIQAFDRKINGFANEEAILSGVETRTSSPVRLIRNEGMEGSIEGIYPCGEGAGYAGGITSAAIDGIKTAEAIAARFRMS